MALPVARTASEALLYLDLLPCEVCGRLRTEWRFATLLAVDGLAAERYAGVCEECGTDRDHVFAAGVEPAAGPTTTRFGGPPASELLDAAQWLDVATEAETAAGDAEYSAGSAAEARQDRRASLEYAREAVVEAMKFLPDGAEEVPVDAVFSERGRQVLATEPEMLTRGWMESMHRAYLELLAELDAGRA
jgi:hypothetical protein